MKYLSRVLLVTLLMAGSVPLVSAQDEIILTVAVPEFIEGQLRSDLFQPFEAEHPGVKVLTVRSDTYPYFTSPVFVGLDMHFEEVEQYVSSADVLFVVAQGLTIESTRAGYFLDLAPLAYIDSTLDIEDFHPAVWQSFEWDEGVWALPSTLDLITLNYVPDLFDEAGLTYPDPSWTLDDLLAAARALTQYDEDGNVEVRGFDAMGELPLLLRALAGEGFYTHNVNQQSAFTEMPNLNQPGLAELLETWAAFEDTSSYVVISDSAQIPMRIERSYGLASNYTREWDSAGALLPGGIAGLDVTGYAVSAGTLYPELAYELAKYLTYDAQVSNVFEMQPARQSLVDAGMPEDDTSVYIRNEFSPENAAFLQEALAHALPVSELRYGDYLLAALNRTENAGGDFNMALQQAATEAIANMEAAAHRDTAMVAVATPVPTPVLVPGEVAIRFAVLGESIWDDQRGRWSALIDDFVAQNPEVGQVVFEEIVSMTPDLLDTLTTEFDCFTMPYNAVASDLPDVLNLDPFFDADPNFDRGDMLAGALAQVTLDNKVWALPLTVRPEMLFYDADAFEAAGVPLPVDGWTPEAFLDALHRLKSNPDDPPPMRAQPYANYALSLIAAFGGLPIDNRVEPSALNFTDPETVEAIRQVLDLARDGYIAYNALNITAGSQRILLTSEERGVILADVLLGEFTLPIGGMVETPYLPTTYPQGDRVSLASYQLKTAYISANAANPEACYRWLSLVSTQPGLIEGMPARRSVLNNPDLAAIFTEDRIDFYHQYDAYLSNPATIVSNPYGGVFKDFFEQHWLFTAFDRYVLEGADLDAELAEAEALATAYRACIEPAASYDPAVTATQEYYDQYTDCALKLDPSLGPFFGLPAD